MLARLFTQTVSTKAEKNKDLIESTKKGFFPLCSTQVGIFHRTVVELIKGLNPNSYNFDYLYNQVVFGSMLIELAIETDKYYADNREKLYPKTVGELVELCGMQRYDREDLIKNVGELILDGSLEFSKQHLEFHFKKSLEYLQNHHPGMGPHTNEQLHIAALNGLLIERHKFIPSSQRYTK